MTPTLWEKIGLAFRYNDAIWHNVFLTIIYILGALSLFILMRQIVRRIAQPQDIQEQAVRPSFFKMVRTWLLGSVSVLAFPVILFLILTLALGGSDSATISSRTLSYERDGVDTSVLLVNKFIANSSGRGVTTGSSKSYVYAMNEETGKLVWKTGIGRAYSPFLMGQTEESIVVFDGSGPLVLSKADGGKLADIRKMESSNTELQGRFPEEAKNYTWDEKYRHIVFQGLDGGLYFIDPDTLQGGTSQAKLSDYFNADESEPEYISSYLSIVPSGQEDGKYQLFLNEETAEQLHSGTFAQEESPNASSETEDLRRRIYEGSLLAGGDLAVKDLKPLLDQVFLRGAFLSDWREEARSSDDPYQLSGFPDYSTFEKAPQMPDSSERVDWPSRMTLSEYEQYQAEEDRRLDNYYAERDQYEEANESYEDKKTLYDHTASSLLIQNGGTPVPPLHYTDESSGHEVFLIVHDASLADDANVLISAVDLEGAKLLWTANTHLNRLDSYDFYGDRLLTIGSGADGNSYLFSLSLQNGSGWGYDFQYDREVLTD